MGYMQSVSPLLQAKCYLIDTSWKDSLFIMGWSNVSHNSLMCLMIGTANNEIIRLHLKFYINQLLFFQK